MQNTYSILGFVSQTTELIDTKHPIAHPAAYFVNLLTGVVSLPTRKVDINREA